MIEVIYYLCKQKLKKTISLKKSNITTYRGKCEYFLSPILTPNLLPEVTTIISFVWTLLVFCYVFTYTTKDKHSIYICINRDTHDIYYSAIMSSLHLTIYLLDSKDSLL